MSFVEPHRALLIHKEIRCLRFHLAPIQIPQWVLSHIRARDNPTLPLRVQPTLQALLKALVKALQQVRRAVQQLRRVDQVPIRSVGPVLVRSKSIG